MASKRHLQSFLNRICRANIGSSRNFGALSENTTPSSSSQHLTNLEDENLEELQEGSKAMQDVWNLICQSCNRRTRTLPLPATRVCDCCGRNSYASS